MIKRKLGGFIMYSRLACVHSSIFEFLVNFLGNTTAAAAAGNLRPKAQTKKSLKNKKTTAATAQKDGSAQPSSATESPVQSSRLPQDTLRSNSSVSVVCPIQSQFFTSARNCMLVLKLNL